ncbi:MAG TPA: HD domain-containing phosphohydrolase [Mariprofundaceae bacterium]|nr:HD domain-containing phosphohydrolase [Mariprofundaceae bacterium]
MLDVLVVEDQPAVREVISEIVSDLDRSIHVHAAGSISEARQELATRRWDGLITDMSLGDGNMLDLIEELGAKGQRIPPAILMSGFLSADRMAKALSLGIVHVMAKPFEPAMLQNCLRKMLFPDAAGQAVAAPASGRQLQSEHRLLPEMFEMDRRLGLVYRMFEEMPGKGNVASICGNALAIALDVVHSRLGFLALYERQRDRLVLVAEQDLGNAVLVESCQVAETPFRTLVDGVDEVLVGQDGMQSCWPGVKCHSHISIPVMLQGVPMGVLCMLDPGLRGEPKSETRQMLGLLIKKLDTMLDNRAVHAALAENMRDTLVALVRSLEARDRYTKDHSGRVGRLGAILAEGLGLDSDHVELIRTGGTLHDIGKVGIPDAVLLKPGRYTEQEFAIMKAHPAIGDSILKHMDTLVRERLMVRHHHERWDGLGYPDQLAGEDIPLDARIICVADAVDAMTTHRVYRMAQPVSFCAEQLRLGAGTQFDPAIVEAALKAIKQGAVISQAEGEQLAEPVKPLSAEISIQTEARH